ncbi:MAG: hypothetical protein NVS3B28_28290 [Candidatus Velthaea sp.]
MNLEIPTLLVFLGAALMAIAIFAPKRRPPQALAASGPAFNAWHTVPEPQLAAPVFTDDVAPPVVSALPALTWPTLVDPRAVCVDGAARVALVQALAALREPWAEVILRRALAEETDLSVQIALESALV